MEMSYAVSTPFTVMQLSEYLRVVVKGVLLFSFHPFTEVLRQFRGNFYHYFGLKSPSHVIQTTEGRKNLGSIHFVLPRFFANALNDKMF